MIRLDDISVVYETTKHQALTDINLTIEKGEFVFIVGQSGAGKSTFIRLLLREIDPISGNIAVDGEDITRLKKRKIPFYRRKLGIVFQDFRLLPDKTVFENIAFAMEIVGSKTSEINRRVPEVLEQVGLSHRGDYFPDQLSGGEQQRVNIARAIVNNPSIIICDEPTGNLDPTTSQGIIEVLKEINKGDTTIIMATHDKDIVDKEKIRVIALRDGKVIGDEEGGYPDEVK